jgi:hypothetical protein
MKIIINKKYLSEQPEQFIRSKASYAHIHSHHTGHDSYVRRLTRDYYPRLHMYIKLEGDQVIFDLHLDQKKVSYKGSHAHNAEYDGDIVEREINRIKGLILKYKPVN